MFRFALVVLVSAIFLSGCGRSSENNQATAESAAAEADTVELLFVQDAKGMSYDGETLILKDTDPYTLFFSDRPDRDGDLLFEVRVIEGTIPESGGESALFIDTVGHPLSPGSVAGVHRRHRRRAERHHRR